MRAITLTHYSKTNDALQLTQVEQPSIGANDVLVKTHAASLNPLDFKIRNGLLKALLPKTFPKILGHDLSGEIVQIGANVNDFKVGDAVFACVDLGQQGTFAQYSAISTHAAALKPSHLSYEEAASLPVVALSSWQALLEIGQLKAGQKVFIPAGSGGVGSIAIQVAKSLGAFVATNTSTKNVEWVKSLGADLVVDYTQNDFSESLKDYDLVFDTLGGETLKKSFGIMKKGGKIVSVAAAVPSVDAAQKLGMNKVAQFFLSILNRPFQKLAKKHGVQYDYLFLKANGQQLTRIANLCNDGAIKPIIDQVFNLEQFKDAFDYLEKGRARGKVVMKID